jgi:hypothetical protein
MFPKAGHQYRLGYGATVTLSSREAERPFYTRVTILLMFALMSDHVLSGRARSYTQSFVGAWQS